MLPEFRRKGVGQELMVKAWRECSVNLNSVEVTLKGSNKSVSRFLERQEWEVVEVKDGEVKYRRECKPSIDDTL